MTVEATAPDPQLSAHCGVGTLISTALTSSAVIADILRDRHLTALANPYTFKYESTFIPRHSYPVESGFSALCAVLGPVTDQRPHFDEQRPSLFKSPSFMRFAARKAYPSLRISWIRRYCRRVRFGSRHSMARMPTRPTNWLERDPSRGLSGARWRTDWRDAKAHRP